MNQAGIHKHTVYYVLRNLFTKYILFAGLLVFQKADTLKFMRGNETVDTWTAVEEITALNHGNLIYTRCAKVSSDNKHFLFYEQEYHTARDSFFTKLTLYKSNQEKIWERCSDHHRKISFNLSTLFDDRVVMVMTDKYGMSPSMEIIKDGKSDTVVTKEQWRRIMEYVFSPNMRYIAFHVKGPYHEKIWNYIHSIDLKTHKNWTYLFPICVSCKRYRIGLDVKNDGTVDVVYKYQHRVFDKTGKLIDIYITFE